MDSINIGSGIGSGAGGGGAGPRGGESAWPSSQGWARSPELRLGMEQFSLFSYSLTGAIVDQVLSYLMQRLKERLPRQMAFNPGLITRLCLVTGLWSSGAVEDPPW